MATMATMTTMAVLAIPEIINILCNNLLYSDVIFAISNSSMSLRREIMRHLRFININLVLGTEYKSWDQVNNNIRLHTLIMESPFLHTIKICVTYNCGYGYSGEYVHLTSTELAGLKCAKVLRSFAFDQDNVSGSYTDPDDSYYDMKEELSDITTFNMAEAWPCLEQLSWSVGSSSGNDTIAPNLCKLPPSCRILSVAFDYTELRNIPHHIEHLELHGSNLTVQNIINLSCSPACTTGTLITLISQWQKDSRSDPLVFQHLPNSLTRLEFPYLRNVWEFDNWKSIVNLTKLVHLNIGYVPDIDRFTEDVSVQVVAPLPETLETFEYSLYSNYQELRVKDLFDKHLSPAVKIVVNIPLTITYVHSPSIIAILCKVLSTREVMQFSRISMFFRKQITNFLNVIDISVRLQSAPGEIQGGHKLELHPLITNSPHLHTIILSVQYERGYDGGYLSFPAKDLLAFKCADKLTRFSFTLDLTLHKSWDDSGSDDNSVPYGIITQNMSDIYTMDLSQAWPHLEQLSWSARPSCPEDYIALNLSTLPSSCRTLSIALDPKQLRDIPYHIEHLELYNIDLTVPAAIDLSCSPAAETGTLTTLISRSRWMCFDHHCPLKFSEPTSPHDECFAPIFEYLPTSLTRLEFPNAVALYTNDGWKNISRLQNLKHIYIGSMYSIRSYLLEETWRRITAPLPSTLEAIRCDLKGITAEQQLWVVGLLQQYLNPSVKLICED